MGAGCVGTFRTIGRVEDEVGEGMVVLAGDWDVEGPAGDGGTKDGGSGRRGRRALRVVAGGRRRGKRKKAPAAGWS